MTEFIAFDWCGWNDWYGRFTHLPTGDTIIQRPGMDQRQWDRAQLEWFRKYPRLVVHRCPDGPYRQTRDTFGTTEEIITKLETRLGDNHDRKEGE